MLYSPQSAGGEGKSKNELTRAMAGGSSNTSMGENLMDKRVLSLAAALVIASASQALAEDLAAARSFMSTIASAAMGPKAVVV